MKISDFRTRLEQSVKLFLQTPLVYFENDLLKYTSALLHTSKGNGFLILSPVSGPEVDSTACSPESPSFPLEPDGSELSPPLKGCDPDLFCHSENVDRQKVRGSRTIKDAEVGTWQARPPLVRSAIDCKENE